jgi:prepilin-type N-terminal cleavage/methylation domain-containing protein
MRIRRLMPNYRIAQKNKRGFTLVETLVALSILLGVATVPISRVADSIQTNAYSKDQTVANYLAQEGVEVVRAIRDANRLETAQDPNGTITDAFRYIDTCVGQTCSIDGKTTNLASALQVCAADCSPLSVDSNGFYYQGLGLGGAQSRFTRTLTITNVSSDERKVTVTVSWRSRPNLPLRSISLSETLFDFQADSSGGGGPQSE